MGNFSKGLNPGNVGALLQGGVQGMQTEQSMQDKYTANQRQQQYLQEQQRENQGGNQLYNATNDFQNRTNGTNNPGFTAQTGNVFDPVRERIHGLAAGGASRSTSACSVAAKPAHAGTRRAGDGPARLERRDEHARPDILQSLGWRPAGRHGSAAPARSSANPGQSLC